MGISPTLSIIYSRYVLAEAVTVENGTTIDSAYLRVVAYEAQSGTVTFSVYAEASDNASMPDSELLVAQKSITSTTATVEWIPDALEAEESVDIDVTTIVQEIVNRSGWACGGNILFVIEATDASAGEFISLYRYEDDATKGPQLLVTTTSTCP